MIRVGSSATVAGLSDFSTWRAVLTLMSLKDFHLKAGQVPASLAVGHASRGLRDLGGAIQAGCPDLAIGMREDPQSRAYRLLFARRLL
jgi:hypothetical protein